MELTKILPIKSIGDYVDVQFVPNKLVLKHNDFSNPREIELEDLSDTIRIKRITRTKYIVMYVGIPRRLGGYGNSYFLNSYERGEMSDVSFKMMYFNMPTNDVLHKNIQELFMGFTIELISAARTFKFLKELEENISLITSIYSTKHKDLCGDETFNGLLHIKNFDKEITICNDCGNFIIADNEHSFLNDKGVVLCEKCFKTKYYICPNCYSITRLTEKCKCGNEYKHKVLQMMTDVTSYAMSIIDRTKNNFIKEYDFHGIIDNEEVDKNVMFKTMFSSVRKFEMNNKLTRDNFRRLILIPKEEIMLNVSMILSKIDTILPIYQQDYTLSYIDGYDIIKHGLDKIFDKNVTSYQISITDSKLDINKLVEMVCELAEKETLERLFFMPTSEYINYFKELIKTLDNSQN